MNRLLYLLILLLISAQVDNYWDVRPVSSSAQLADEDDEYLASERQTQADECSGSREQMFFGTKPRTADLSFVPRSVPSGWNLTTPFAPLASVLMSMQI